MVEKRLLAVFARA